MPYPSNAFAVEPRSRTDASVTRGMAPGPTRLPPDILTYCYDSRMVFVTRGESYDRAIAIAVESFPELADVERDRISLEVRVLHGNQHEKKATIIGRTAWSAIVATLAQHEVVEIRVAPPPKSTPAPPVPIIGPPTLETGWSSDAEGSHMNLDPRRSQMPASMLEPQSHTAGLHEKSIAPKSSQLPSDILTYCYDSRMVYVTRDEDYDRAIDIAIESFPELRGVGRERICLEVRVVHRNHWQQEKEMTEIGRTAWSAVVATLASHQIVGIRVAAPPKSTPKSIPKSAAAHSSSAPSVADPSPSKTGRSSNAEGSQTNLVPRRPQIPSSTFDPQSHSTGLREKGITPKSSQLPPDLLKYCYNSRMVYVAPGEDYDQAIDIAQDSFPELADVERNRICLEVRVMHGNQQEKETTVISRTAWSVIVRTLARHEVVEIRVAPPPKPAPKSAMASSNPTPSVANLPRLEKGWSSDAEGSQMNLASRRPQMPSSMLGPQSHTIGLHEKDIIPKPSHPPPDILTYCYKSRTVYVIPGEDYDQAIDIAQDSFPELIDVERNRICLEVCVGHGDQKKATEIGRTAWPIVVPTLARHEVVEIRVAAAPPKSAPSVVGPPPSKTGSYPDGSQMNLVPRRSQMPSSMLEPQSHTTGLRETGITPKTSQVPPNLLAYSYNSRIVHVTPAEDYNRAIDIAIESFPELRGFERGRIQLGASVKRSQQEKKTAKNSGLDWSAVVATPERYGIVEIRVLPPPNSIPKSSRGRHPPQPSRQHRC